jgi:hypothetical protein
MGPAQKASTAQTSASTFGSTSSPLAAMSTTSTSNSTPEPSTTIDKLLANIPCLELNGSNWAIFQMRFHDVMKVTHCWAYFTGLKSCPESEDPKDVTKEEKKAIEK